MRSFRSKSVRSGDVQSPTSSTTPALAPETHAQHRNSPKNLFARGWHTLLSPIRRASRRGDATAGDKNVTTQPPPTRLTMGTLNSDKAFVMVNTQENGGGASHHEKDAVVGVTPPPERDGHVESSLQSIDYADATDLGPLVVFNDKFPGELANVHPRVKATLNGLLWASQMVVHQDARDKSVYKLLWKIREVYEFMIRERGLEEVRRTPDVLAVLSEQVVECAGFVVQYACFARLWARLDKDVLAETDATIQKYAGSLDSSMAVLQGRAVHGTQADVYHVLEEVDRHDSSLNAVVRASETGLDPTKTCLEGTRGEILDELVGWAYGGDEAQRVFWLSGDEGTGKSAIVHTVARWLKEAGSLGSFFCFDVTRQSDCGAETLFTTIARDLANFDPSLRQDVADAVLSDASRSSTVDVLSQWQKLVLGPLSKSASHLGPVVIIIDALDECRQATSRELVVRVLADESIHLPANVRILLTSRPTSDMRVGFQDKTHVRAVSLDDIPRENVERDIRLYVSRRLPTLRDEQYASLTTKADGLFEWARIVCEFVSSPDQGELSVDDLLGRVLSPPDRGLRLPLDQMYSLILKLAIDDSLQTYQFNSVMRQVLGTLEPLPIASLTKMRLSFSLPKDRFNVNFVLGPIASLVAGVSDQTSPVRVFHASFRDFLTDRARSDKFFVDLDGVHQDLAVSTLASMQALKFNMCGLEDSHLSNHDVPDLAQRVRERISPHLSYSCRFWMAHVRGSTFDVHLADELRSFFKHERLLFWLEVLGLLGRIDEVHAALAAASELIQGRDEYTDTLVMMRDVRHFVKMFGNVITQSTPHLYLSALPFAPRESSLAGLFSSKVHRVPRVTAGHDAGWPSAQLSFTGHADWVRSVAISRDGERIASGADDSTVRIWNAETGLEVGSPLEHGGFVMSVAFSPDGRIVVSGASDATIRLWDVPSGLPIGGPLRGHAGSVNSVAFSPDGTWFASGSSDGTVRIWDVRGHAQVGLLEGHASSINVVATSLNGERIASGASDGTIRVWSTLTWSQVGDPIHAASPVHSVAFAPDGGHVVAGSDDALVRVWHVRTGSRVCALEGHIDHVTSVAFSVDGRYIVSGSTDRTVRVWDAATFSQVGRSLAGHTGRVSSVAISHDGRTVASGSWDGTIRTWDVKLSPMIGSQSSAVLSVALSPAKKRIVSGSFDGTVKVFDAATGTQVACSQPLQGHTSSVVSVALSSDGTRIASGSSDKTVRIWDMETGAAVGGPLVGHASRVNSVAFSPDGKWVASGSDDGTVRVWDVASARVVTAVEAHGDAVNAVAFSFDGQRFVSGSADNTMRVWDARTGSVVGGPLTGHARPVRSVAFSPDGTRIASGSSDRTVRLWNAEEGSPVRTLEGHTDAVRSVAFSPDGRHVVSGSDDGTVRAWDATTGWPLFGGPLVGHTAGVRSVALDAEWIVSGSEDGSVRVWDLETVLRGDDSLDVGDAVPGSNAGKERYVRFSPFARHALHDSPGVDGRTDVVRVREDGWVEAVVGARRHLFFWVPAHWRDALLRYSRANVMVIPRGVELDLSEAVHGRGWAACWVE